MKPFYDVDLPREEPADGELGARVQPDGKLRVWMRLKDSA
jgi:hypothetical protein